MELVTLSRPELVRLAALRRYRDGGVTQDDLARCLGLSQRQVRRLIRRLEALGEAGLASRKRGRPSNRRLPEALLDEALRLVRERYPDFGPTFANEKLREIHGLQLGTETLRSAMIAAGLWSPKRRPQRHVHPPRERRPSRGELVQVDGSHHGWFEKRGPRCVLHTAVDDATSELLAAHFAEEETSAAYAVLFCELIGSWGTPLAVYSDRSSIFSINTNGARGEGMTQIGRALDELDVELICANTPQAKGRVERAYQTLQKRLVLELRLAGISTIDDANRFLPTFITDYNHRFAVEPACATDAFRQTDAPDLARIFAKRYTRTLTKNLTFQVGKAHFRVVDIALPARLRGTVVDIRFLGESMQVERRGTILRWEPIALEPRQAAVVPAKQLARHLDRSHHPEKAHAPAATHPWRIYRSRLQPGEPDKSTRREPDTMARG
jgi:DNA-binding MarR family transcriptional regulator